MPHQINSRIDTLLARMTLEETIDQMEQEPQNDPRLAKRHPAR